MTVLLLVVCLGGAWYILYVPANTIAWAGGYPSAQQQASRSGKPILLFFTGEWCVPCRIMKRNILADTQVAVVVNSGFIPVMIDVDDPDAAAVLDRYGVGPTPNTIITDPQGEVLQQVQGRMGKSEFLMFLGVSEGMD